MTPQQVLLLAPDPASVTAARPLAAPDRWQNSGRSGRAVWAELRYSGDPPYRAAVDLSDATAPVFRCTCPSRKYPCKHGLGLLLLHANAPEYLPADTEPEWAATWLDKRAAKAAAPPPPPAASDPAQQEQRREIRLLNAQAAANELERWLADVLRAGLLQLPDRGATALQQLAARMVDLQSPGLAAQVRALQALLTEAATTGDEWTNLAFEHLCRLWLAGRALHNFAQLPTAAQHDLRTLAGFGPGPKEVLADATAERVNDHWLLLARRTETLPESDITAQRDWLIGCTSGRYAVVLLFGFKSQPIENRFAPGPPLAAELAFFPGQNNLRATVVNYGGVTTDWALPATAVHPDWATAFAEWTANVARQPWSVSLHWRGQAEPQPAVVADLRPMRTPEGWWLRDRNGAALPLPKVTDERPFFHLLAVAGDAPLTVAVLRHADVVEPLGIVLPGGRYLSLNHASGALWTARPVVHPAWQALLQTALLGTERRTLPLDILPATVQAALPPAEAVTAENRFFTAAALTLVFCAAAQQPPRPALPELPDLEVEPLPGCSPRAVSLWFQINALENTYPALEARWLNLCHQRGAVLAPELLVDVFQMGAVKRGAELQPLIRAVAGARGRWLAAQNPAWRYVLPPDYAQMWAEGKPTERVEALRYFRQTDPAAGRALVAASWPGDSAADRRRWVTVLAEHLTPDDAPWLETVLAELAALPGEKAVVQDLKRALVGQLLRLPSGLRSEWAAALSTYVGRSGPTLTLPEEEDAFFNPQKMVAQAGLSSPKKGGHNAVRTWLVELVGLVSPTWWCNFWGVNAERVLTYFADNEWFTPSEQAALRERLLTATHLHADAAMAEALLPLVAPDEIGPLLALLPPARREQVLSAAPEPWLQQLTWTLAGLPALRFEWSLAFSNWMLQRLYRSWSVYYFSLVQQVMPLDCFLHPDTQPEQIPDLRDEPYQRDRWLAMIVPELEKVQTVKKLLQLL